MMDSGPLAELLGSEPHARGRIYGVVVGIVTNNQDPSEMGRVRVRFPWLSGSNESGWARVAAPMAGKQMGAYFLPEIDDEVLVVFEHGRVDRPIVIGSLWNGKDGPPEKNADGKNNLRVIKSRSGHTVTLDDTDGAEKITIADGKKKNVIVLDAGENALSITSEGDLTVKAKGKLRLESDGGEVSIKGSVVKINDSKLKVQ